MRKTKEETLLTREQLIDSALSLFLAQGYAGVTMQQIAEKTGMTRGAFYWHFKSKEEILYAICERETEFIAGLMSDVFDREVLSADEHLRVVLSKILENYFENQRYRDFVELTWFKMEHLADDQVNRLKTVSNDFFTTECQKIVRRGITQGVFTAEASPETWAMHLTALINGIYRLYFISPHHMSKKTALTIVDQCLSALKG